MKKIDINELPGDLEDLVRSGSSEAVIITKNGQPLAAVTSLVGSDWETVSVSTNPRFVAIIEKSRRSIREEGTVSMEEVRQRLGLPQPKRKGALPKPAANLSRRPGTAKARQ